MKLDITKINEKELPDFDLMTWGFPCQDISIAGKQAGIKEGTRSGLYYDGLRILKEKKPKYSLIENVKALTSKKFKDTFESILDDLDKAGYNNYWQVLDAKDYGIPQHRERVFIVSIRKDINQEFTFPEKEELTLKLKDLLEDEVEEKYYLSDRMINSFSDMTNRNGFIRGKCFKPHSLDDDRVASTIKTTAGSRPEDNFVKRKYDEFIDEKGYMPEIFNPYNKSEIKEVARTITGECGSTTSSSAHLITTEPRLYDQAFKTLQNNECENGDTIDAFNQRVNKSGISPTVTTRPEGFKTAILIPEATKKGFVEASDGDGVYINRPHQKRGVVQKNKIQTLKTTLDVGVVVEKKQESSLKIRKLTPLECWRLMGFDDSDFYKAQGAGISNTQLYKQAGNSIVVNVLEKIFINLFKGE